MTYRYLLPLAIGPLYFSCCGAADTPEPVETPVYRIPRLTDIEIDGDAADWGDRGFQVQALASLDGQNRPGSSFDAAFRLGWSAEGLLLLFQVRDDRFFEHSAEDSLWQRDSLEIYLADHRGGDEMVQVVVAPGMTEEHPAPRWHLHDHRRGEDLKTTDYAPHLARAKTKDGYSLELLMPWTGLGIDAELGMEIGLQVLVNDVDTEDARVFNLLWYPGVAVFADRMRTHRLELSETASPPVRATARARYRGLQHTEVNVFAAESMAGEEVRVEAGERTVARDVLTINGGRALARLQAPLPPPDGSWTHLDVYSGDVLLNRLPLPATKRLRDRVRRRLSFVFERYCFRGDQLPTGRFENPVEAENAFGPHTVSVEYYNAAHEQVTAAAAPGRYTAVVTITPETADPVHRYGTLFRMPGKMALPRAELDVRLGFPEELGFPSNVVEEQQETLGDFVHGAIVDSLRGKPASARVFAWLYEVEPGTVTTARNDPRSRDLAHTYELRRKLGLDAPYEYLVQQPPQADGDAPKGERFPAIIHLHGSGACTLPLDALKHGDLATYAREHPELRLIVVNPHCPEGEWWQTPKLDDLYDEVMAKYPIDPDRVYLTGESLGGFGTWLHGAARPDRFAALAPLCGGGDAREARYLKDVPIWAFHGARDPAVPLKRSEEMVEALREVEANVRFTVYPEAGHGIWPTVYEDPEFYAWLLDQQRPER